ncbi:hypothetical protein VB712_17820 [Spirulina sp. CCNP1310]|uniref:hypothetical protein n=1 Tax=Spirulina sp. CCNP1310 TaxID=3110249 RepID=UPI002B214E6F|nr:hypothetical protein [Spirulina sp. CCNP1310]MEA5421087.1 hypothetical protein [Spirulina sp. CCNP1310]
MKDITGIVIGLVLCAGVGVVALKLTIPWQYRETELRSSALSHLAHLQTQTPLSPVAAAQAYAYFGTDYQDELPPRIRITTKSLGKDEMRVEFYDPNAQDDSIWEKRTRIFLRQNAVGHWVPYHSEWSHKGRGRFGWTTEPTI